MHARVQAFVHDEERNVCIVHNSLIRYFCAKRIFVIAWSEDEREHTCSRPTTICMGWLSNTTVLIVVVAGAWSLSVTSCCCWKCPLFRCDPIESISLIRFLVSFLVCVRVWVRVWVRVCICVCEDSTVFFFRAVNLSPFFFFRLMLCEWCHYFSTDYFFFVFYLFGISHSRALLTTFLAALIFTIKFINSIDIEIFFFFFQFWKYTNLN